MKNLLLILLLTSTAFAGRKVTLGFEIGVAGTGKGVPSPDGFTAQVFNGGISTGALFRSGTYARLYTCQTGNNTQDLMQSISCTAPIYARTWFRGAVGDDTPSRWIQIWTFTEGSNSVSMVLTITRRLALMVNGTYTDSTTNPITNADGWYLCKIYSTWAASGNTHILKVGSQTMTRTDNFTSPTPSNLTLWFGAIESQSTSMSIHFDDFSLNDATGDLENNFPDDSAHIVFMPVVVDTSIGDWVAGAGATTSLFEALNNLPPTGTTDADATNIKNVTSSATSDYDGATLSYNTFGIPSTSGIRVIVPVTRHGEHAATGTISGAVKLVSNPPDTAEATFTYGADAGAHGADNATGTLKWYTAYGTPVYGRFIEQYINRDARPVVRVGKRTATTAQACVDLLGLVVEYGSMTGRIRRHHF